MDLGTTVEYHFIPGPVSPYVGASVSLGYMTQSNVTSAVTGSLGAVAGIEVFILDFLSVFAEYEVAADLTDTTDLQTSQSTFDYCEAVGRGNFPCHCERSAAIPRERRTWMGIAASLRFSE